MAIDLFCYASASTTEVQAELDLMVSKHKGLFTERFLVSKACDVESIQKEIALEYGLNASCRFLIRLNDKSVADLLPTVEILVKNALGVSNVVILFENETLR